MIVAVIDLGSNTIRLSVYSCEKNKVTVILRAKAMAGLAGYVEEGRLAMEGIGAACEALEEFQETLGHVAGLEKISVFATASLRNVKNTVQAVEEIYRRTGLTVEVLSGEEEARLDFVGATYALDLTSGVLADIGGGSTELVFFDQRVAFKAVSMPIGSLNLTTRYVDGLFPSEREQKKLEAAVKKALGELEPLPAGKFPVLCGVGGSIRATLKLYNRLLKLDKRNQRMEVRSVEQLLKKLLEQSQKDCIKTISRAAPDRLYTLLTGIVTLLTLTSRLGCDEILVSAFGVREGYLYDRILEEGNHSV